MRKCVRPESTKPGPDRPSPAQLVNFHVPRNMTLYAWSIVWDLTLSLKIGELITIHSLQIAAPSLQFSRVCVHDHINV